MELLVSIIDLPLYTLIQEASKRQLTAQYINKSFTNIGPKLAKEHRSYWKYFGKTVVDSIEPIITNVAEVIKLCKEIEPLKSSDMDQISSNICKDAFLVLGHQLTHLFNYSLLRSVFPNE